MQEIERIDKNIDGQVPKGEKTIIKVTGIDNASYVLENCKKTVKAFLQNRDLNEMSEQWKILIPENIISFIDKLEEYDFGYDDLLYSLHSLINSLQTNKNWEWYSSKLNEGGFEITTTSSFHPRFIWMVHCQNIPYAKIDIEDDRFGNYNMRISVVKDVTEYKKFD